MGWLDNLDKDLSKTGLSQPTENTKSDFGDQRTLTAVVQNEPKIGPISLPRHSQPGQVDEEEDFETDSKLEINKKSDSIDLFVQQVTASFPATQQKLSKRRRCKYCCFSWC
jgi:hypothetical protein